MSKKRKKAEEGGGRNHFGVPIDCDGVESGRTRINVKRIIGHESENDADHAVFRSGYVCPFVMCVFVMRDGHHACRLMANGNHKYR